ncbi:hypothetical protein BpHYR1_035685 [Brachionus plicatilis]|uniref:Uncharacterized protein n=1 Tax=Brachionus plicatilis TaxID=10195 RepID=A0A3M7QKY5_BRAPC|nr:hypothetical protein BpHYR1_035685 [Brachionus plicatilis]
MLDIIGNTPRKNPLTKNLLTDHPFTSWSPRGYQIQIHQYQNKWFTLNFNFITDRKISLDQKFLAKEYEFTFIAC